MTKRQVIWLLIRLAGLWFLWQSVTSAVALGWLGTYLQASEESGLLPKSTGFLFLQSVVLLGVYLALGLYCLRSGTALFNLLNREDPDDRDSDADSTRPSTLGLP